MRTQWQESSLTALATVLFLATLYLLRDLTSGIILGLLAAYFAMPLQRRLAAKLRRPRVAAALVLLSGVIVIAIPFVIMVGVVAFQGLEAVQGFDAAAAGAKITAWRNDVYGSMGWTVPSDGVSVAETLLPALRERALPILAAAVATTSTVALTVLIATFCTYYALVDGHRALDFLLSHSPLGKARTKLLIDESERVTYGVFYGQIVASIAQGVLGGLGFFVAGVPNVLMWTFVMTVLAILPVVGAFLIWMPASFWLYFTGHHAAGIGLFLWGALAVSQVDNVLKPMLVGDKANIHPLIVLLGVFGGLATFGFLGFLLGPLVLALFLASVRAVKAMGTPEAATA